MFGRRNADALPVQRPAESDVSLDDLPDLPDILAAPASPATSGPELAPAQAERPSLFRSAAPTEHPPVASVAPASTFPPTTPASATGVSAASPSATPASATGVSAASPSATPPPAPSSGLGSLAGLTGTSPQPSGLFGGAVPAAPAPAPTPAATPAVAPPSAGARAGAPVAVVAAEARSTESVIGPDDFFDGTYRSERGVRIQGTAHGSIESRQSIYVEAGAQVEASLSAEEITVAGVCTGTIECRGRLEITGTGRIKCQVATARLIIREGGVLDGQIQMRGEGEK